MAAAPVDINWINAKVSQCSSLNELYAFVNANRLAICPQMNVGNTVFQGGNPNAGIMLIGNQPGEYESGTGVAFSNPEANSAGHNLYKFYLPRLGVSAEQVYLSNAVFWCPPGGRDPNAEEIARCQVVLRRQIQLVKPALILLLGQIAVRLMGNDVHSMRGRVHDYDTSYLLHTQDGTGWKISQSSKVIVTYNPGNPAFNLEAGNVRADLDLARATFGLPPLPV